MKTGIILFLLPVLAGCALRFGRMTPTQRGERLAIERGRLTELTDPVERTRSYITISKLLLSFASDAVHERDFDDLNALMDQLIATMKAARDTMVTSDIDAKRHPEGYKDLEGVLRAHGQFLRDLRSQLTVEERRKVEDAQQAVAGLRQEILRYVFPQKVGFALIRHA
jgi:hypothetical protein